MQTKTITRVITKKLNEWLLSITNEALREDVRKNLLVSGGSITSLFFNEQVNDFDIYIQDIDVLVRLAEYYVPTEVLDGRKRDEYLLDLIGEKKGSKLSESTLKYLLGELDANKSQMAVRYKNLKPDQVKLDIESFGRRIDYPEYKKEDLPDYIPVFLSQNAISLSGKIQIVLRFSGTPEEIHKNFDYLHATNYFTFEKGLVTNVAALESTLTKELKYQGSLYPVTSIIRMKKFLKRGWKINAGEILKIIFQISELDLRDPEVLEEQLIGVDIAYFSKLIDVLRGVPREKIDSGYINTIIDRVFSQLDDEINEE